MANKVCFVIPSLQPGGMERVMAVLINYFAKKEGLEVHLILYGIKRDIFFELPSNIIIHRPAFLFDNTRRIYSTIKTLIFLRKAFFKLKPHTVLSFGEYWNNFVLLASLGLSLKIYVSDRCQPDKSLGWLHNILRRWLYPKSAGVIAQTERAKQIYQRQIGGKIFAIGNPIRKIDVSRSLPENIVLSVGRLISTKHHDRLIDIFLSINKPDWKLVIVGDNALKQDMRSKLEHQIAISKAASRVVLSGVQSDVESYYKRSKIFAFTSSSEGFPNVIGEAMSAGLPVVAYDCVAGPSEMINDEVSGFLIPLFDDKRFEERLKLLMENEDQRIVMGQQAKNDIQQFDADNIAEKFYKLIVS